MVYLYSGLIDNENRVKGMSYNLLKHIAELEERLIEAKASSFKNWQHEGQSDSKAISNKSIYLVNLKASIEERKKLAIERGLI